MKKISKSLYDACEYYNSHLQEPITTISQLFGVDRHSITRHLSDYKKFCYLKDNYYYYLSEDELIPVNYFLEHPELSMSTITTKFNTKSDTIKRRLSVIGKEYQARTKRKFNRQAFSKLETEEQAYWLGFILADGYINEDRGFLKIKLMKADEDHLIKFCIFMQEDPSYIKYETGGANTRDNICVVVEFDSRELVNDLVKYNLHQCKSGKEEPIQIKNDKLQLAYIRGMIDGDGHIEDGYFKYVGSLKSCQYIKNIFVQWYNFNPDKKYIYEHGTIYSFEIRSCKVNQILKQIYNGNIYLERKYQTVQNF